MELFPKKTMGIPDVYNSKYATEFDAAAKIYCLPLKVDPFLLGILWDTNHLEREGK
jgi:hypothetical protein